MSSPHEPQPTATHWVLVDGEPGGYGAWFPDLPGCTAMADTVAQLLDEAAPAAAADWLLCAREDGDEVPTPREVRALLLDAEVNEALDEGALLRHVAVPVETP